MKLYESNKAWSQLNEFLPENLQLRGADRPEEVFWTWRGNSIHLDIFRRPAAEYRLFLHHGVGTNGRQLNMIFGQHMAKLGYEVIAIDNLGYGMTTVRQENILYGDWVDAFVDLVNSETMRDPKKIILYGLSAGGMLAYHAACLLPKVHGIIGMCFLDNRNQTIRDVTARSILMSRAGGPWLKVLAQSPLRRTLISMKLISKMSALVNNANALKIFLQDPQSAGAKVQLQFMASFLDYVPSIEAKNFDKCPILLTQPAEDRWTPLELSKISLSGLKAPLTIKALAGTGHFPIEENGIKELIASADKFIKSLPSS